MEKSGRVFEGFFSGDTRINCKRIDFLNGNVMGELDTIGGMSVEAENAKALSIHHSWLQKRSAKSENT